VALLRGGGDCPGDVGAEEMVEEPAPPATRVPPQWLQYVASSRFSVRQYWQVCIALAPSEDLSKRVTAPAALAETLETSTPYRMVELQVHLHHSASGTASALSQKSGQLHTIVLSAILCVEDFGMVLEVGGYEVTVSANSGLAGGERS
jgi:hypothetical protein